MERGGMDKTRQIERVIFAILVLLHLLPIWTFEFIPSQDGPAHLNNANVIRTYNLPESDHFRQYYQLSPHPEPNWSGHLILAALTWLVPPLLAQKILLTIFVLLFPLLLRYALVGVNRDAGFLAVLGFPFIYSYPLHIGFYNFCIGLALFFLPLGYLLRHRERITPWRALVMAFMLIVVYFSHFVALLASGLAIGTLVCWDLGSEFLHRGWRGGALLFRRRALGPLVALLPPALLAAAFLERQGAKLVAGSSIRDLAISAAGLASLVSFQPWEQICTWALSVLFFLVAGSLFLHRLVRRELGRREGLLATALAFALVYLLAPAKLAGGAVINERLMLFPFLMLLLWFGTATWQGRARVGLQAAAVLIALGLSGMHARDYVRINDYLREYLTVAPHIEPRSTLLPLSFSQRGHTPEDEPLTQRLAAFIHAAGYIAAQRNLVDLKNYEATTGHFPVIYRPELNPYLHIGVDYGLESIPPRVNFIDYAERTGGSVDYVLLWRVRERQRYLRDTMSIFRQLEEGYELIHTSEPRGFVQLWRRRDLPSE